MGKEEALKKNIYPGRGIVAGMTPDGRNLVQIYWIMGRSVNSRNRIFLQESKNVRTKAFDESKLTDPSLVIYYPVREYKNCHIVTNGDQTDTIVNFLSEGKTFSEALLTREFEPDIPNCTPRISAMITYEGTNSSLVMSILKTVDNNHETSVHNFYRFSGFTPGYGRCIHTYSGDGEPLPSFQGEPYEVTGLHNEMEKTAEYYWGMLNQENRVAILTKYIDIDTGKTGITIINSLS